MLKDKKGQALVEFLIILPVTLLLIFCVVDFGRIISLKNDLESVTSDVVTFYQDGKTTSEIESIINENRKDEVKLEINTNGYYVTIKVSKKIEPITPGLTYIKSDVFNVSATRVIRNE